MVHDGTEACGFLDARADAVNRRGDGLVRFIFQDENADGGFAGAVEAGAYADALDGWVAHEFGDVLFFDLARVFNGARGDCSRPGRRLIRLKAARLVPG